jgi:hypothetical protein
MSDTQQDIVAEAIWRAESCGYARNYNWASVRNKDWYYLLAQAAIDAMTLE